MDRVKRRIPVWRIGRRSSCTRLRSGLSADTAEGRSWSALLAARLPATLWLQRRASQFTSGSSCMSDRPINQKAGKWLKFWRTKFKAFLHRACRITYDLSKWVASKHIWVDKHKSYSKLAIVVTVREVWFIFYFFKHCVSDAALGNYPYGAFQKLPQQFRHTNTTYVCAEQQMRLHVKENACRALMKSYKGKDSS